MGYVCIWETTELLCLEGAKSFGKGAAQCPKGLPGKPTPSSSSFKNIHVPGQTHVHCVSNPVKRVLEPISL